METSDDPLTRLAVFAKHIPDEWVSAAATLSAKATVCWRRLSSNLVLWLVVGMAFFRNEPISEVARRLNICAKDQANDWSSPRKTALISQLGLSGFRTL